MSFELYQHKMNVLERHREHVGRDPSEIKRTLLAPLLITDEKAEAERFNEARGYRSMDRTHGNYAGPLMAPKLSGSLAGPRGYIIDRIGQFAEAGVDEIMFGAIPTGDVEALQRVEEEVVPSPILKVQLRPSPVSTTNTHRPPPHAHGMEAQLSHHDRQYARGRGPRPSPSS